jgi:ferrous iron transport protein B
LIWFTSYLPGSHLDEERVLGKIRQLEAQFAASIEQQTQLDQQREEPDVDEQQLAAINKRLASLHEELGPLHDLYFERNKVSEKLLTDSYLGQFGKLIEPLVKPLGWDWRIGVGVIASFPAREVIVATLGTIYSLGGDVDEKSSGLQSALQEARWPDGRKVYSIPVALSIMVFFALCAQCASTLVVIRRETNHWGWAAFTFVYMTSLAYVGAWLAYTIGSLLIP